MPAHLSAAPAPLEAGSAAADEIRPRLALALDVDDAVAALQLARELRPWFGVAKVGLELFSATGPDVIVQLLDHGFEVFLDLKMVDIPTTVGKAARVVGSLGASYLTMYAHGGADMLRAGTDGMLEGAELAGLEKPTPLAVTILTSDDTAPPHILGKRLMLAMEGGCLGVVCAASDLREVHQLAPRMATVVPGIRPAAAATHDQARPATPGEAISHGASVLVIGRAVTQAPDRRAAAAAIAAEAHAAL
jgi:orotidine-5'-phosphate decarboxylase